jgi:hypothetical protein
MNIGNIHLLISKDGAKAKQVPMCLFCINYFEFIG